MITKIREKLKNNWIYIIEFLFFYYIFIKTPPVCDRWHGSMCYEKMEDFWQYLFVWPRWYTIANGRILPGFLCGIIEQNAILLAFVNAILTTSVSIVMLKLTKTKTIFIQILSFAVLLFVSEGIQAEVYFYATTLYVGATLLVLLIALQIKKRAETKDNKTDIGIYALILVGSTWLENISIALTVAFFLITVVYYVLKKKEKVFYFKCLFASGIGTLFLFISSRFGQEGRLSNARETLKLEQIISNSLELSNLIIRGNLILWIILFIELFMILKNIEYKKFNKLLKGITVVASLGFIINLIILLFQNIYQRISVNPSDYEFASIVLGWKPYKYNLIEKIFDKINIIEKILLPLSIVGAVFLILIIIKIIKNRELYIYHLIVACIGCVFYIFDLDKGERVLAISVFMLSSLIILLASEIVTSNSFKYKNALILSIILFMLIRADAYVRTINAADQVEQGRKSAAQKVVEQQRLGEWDYEDILIMPYYESDINLVGGDRKNPMMSNAYYQYLLKYYGLNKDTLVSFSNNGNKLYVQWGEEENTIEITLQGEKGKSFLNYKFQVISIEAGTIIYDSEEILNNQISWKLPKELDVPMGILFKCILTTEKEEKIEVYAAKTIGINEINQKKHCENY